MTGTAPFHPVNAARPIRGDWVCSLTISDPETDRATYDALKGLDGFSADGEKVGTIDEILHPAMDMPAARGQHFFLLNPGLMKGWSGGFNHVYLPEPALETVGVDRITLNQTAKQIEQLGKEWTTEPNGVRDYRRV